MAVLFYALIWGDMPALLDQLHQDHIHTAKLLDALSLQLKQVNRWTMSDFDLMLDIVEYLTQYSDDLHHPRENLVYARLSQRRDDLDDTLVSIVEEHDAIGAHGLELRDCLMSVRSGSIVLQETICNELTHYVDNLRDHMDLEEARLFPLARQTLTPEDWNDIEAAIANKADPLFGPRSEERYEKLLQFLESELATADSASA